jgi:hypothetical protein
MSRRVLAALAATAALPGLVMTPPAMASKTQESIFMDDPAIVYAAPNELEGTLTEIKQLGADRIRVSVFWRLLAPDRDSETPPFAPGAGADPRNYSAEKWDRYDRIVTTAQQVGLKVLFNVTSPAPRWATPTPPRADLEDSYRPDPEQFRDFVKAVGTRYSGSFMDEEARQDGASVLDECEPTPNFPLPPPLCPPEGNDPTPDNPNPPNTGPVLPRVDTWSAWNEPNMPGWLTPQSDENDTRLPASPHVYRGLADAMYTGLTESGHGGDTILIGETAPRGARERAVTQSLRPLLFVRELYCLDSRFRPFSGDAARRRDCPDGGGGFRAAHPVLFDATAFAHHPYAFERPPRASDPNEDDAVLADLGRLTRTLDLALGRYGSNKRFEVWLTEYGYQTDPPDPYAGWPWRTQARWLAEAEWLAYQKRRVHSTAQFLLYDDGPMADYPPSDPRHWGTFQTGLRTREGERKTAYATYQHGIHVIKRDGRAVRVFGYWRGAPGRTPARIEFRRKGAKRWRVVKRVETNAAGYLLSKVDVGVAGTFRLVFG